MVAGPACCSLSWWASGARCGQSSQVSHLVLHQGGDLLQAARQLHLLAHGVLLQGANDLSGQKRVPCLSPGLSGPASISAVADSCPGPPWGIWTDAKFLPNLGPSSSLPAGLGLNSPLPTGVAPSPGEPWPYLVVIPVDVVVEFVQGFQTVRSRGIALWEAHGRVRPQPGPQAPSLPPLRSAPQMWRGALLGHASPLRARPELSSSPGSWPESFGECRSSIWKSGYGEGCAASTPPAVPATLTPTSLPAACSEGSPGRREVCSLGSPAPGGGGRE